MEETERQKILRQVPRKTSALRFYDASIMLDRLAMNEALQYGINASSEYQWVWNPDTRRHADPHTVNRGG